MDKGEFVNALLGAFPDDCHLSDEAKLFVVAQAALESGWGTSTAASVHNYFNLSAGTHWQGKTLAGGDTEYDATGNVKPITQQWRVYDSPAACLADYWSNFLQWPRYQWARDALLANQGEKFIEYLGPDRTHATHVVGGFYTLRTDEYLRRWRSCLAMAIAAAPNTGQICRPPRFDF